MKRLLACATAALFLSACASTEKDLAAKGMKPLDAASIQTLLAGNTSVGNTASGNSFVVFNAPDGTLRGKSGNATDTGQWEVMPDGQQCNTWKTWRGGARRCAKLYDVDGEIRYYEPDGSFGGRYKMERGNPYNL